jgi:hypothetical protein
MRKSRESVASAAQTTASTYDALRSAERDDDSIIGLRNLCDAVDRLRGSRCHVMVGIFATDSLNK